jgi:hypothetical protein
VKARKLKFEKLQISGFRRGEIRYDHAYNARDAARKATKLARKGYDVKVRGRGPQVRMHCEPTSKRDRTYASCTMTPTFKRQIKGL